MTNMDKKEIIEGIYEIDDEVLYTIIDCIKELFLNGKQMCFWDRDAIMDVVDEVIEANNN